MVESQDEEIKEIFALFDKNSDGKVNTDELGTIVRALNMNPTEAEIIDMKKEIDKESKGCFKVEELIRLVKSKNHEKDSLSDLVDALKVFDTDHDDKLTIEEFKYAMMNMGEKMQEHEIEEIITDNDLIDGKHIEIKKFAGLIMNRI